MKFKVPVSKRVFSGRLFDVFADWVELEDGRQVYREVLKNHKEVAAVVPLDGDEVILVKQFRYPVRKEILEIPAGLVEEGEAPRVCARRELLEETACRARSIKEVATFYSTPGYCNEFLHLFLATGLQREKAEIDKKEVSEVVRLSLEEAIEWFLKGKIVDGKTGLGLFLVYFIKKQGKI